MAFGNGGSYGEATKTTTGIGGIERRTSMVQEQMERVDKSIAALHHAINELEQRLSPVLQPDAPTPASNTSAPQAQMSAVPLAGVLCSQGDQLSHALQRLQHVITRLEI